MSHSRVLRPLGLAALVFVFSSSFAPPSYGAARAGRVARTVAAVPIGAGVADWLSGAWKAIACFVIPGATCVPPGGVQPTSDYGCSADPSGEPRCGAIGFTPPSSPSGPDEGVSLMSSDAAVLR